MNLFIDIETTGVPKKGAHWETDYKSYPRILSVAWKYNSVEHYYVVFQSGRDVPKSITDLTGLTSKHVNDVKRTKFAGYVFSLLLSDASKAANIIGHNVYFDISIIKANMLLEFGPGSKQCLDMLDAFSKDKRLDTMRYSAKMCRGWPKLNELYFFLFKQTFNHHNALDDMVAVERCYNEMKRLGVI